MVDLAIVTSQQAENLTQLTTSVGQLGMIVQQLGAVMAAMDQRIQSLEQMLDRKVTITGAQAKTLQGAVRARAKEVCTKYSLDYQIAGKRVRDAIYADLMQQYQVDDIHDLRASYLDLAKDRVDNWMSFSTIRGIRSKLEQ